MKRGSAQGSLVTKPEDPANPFSMNWLDSCYQETLLPGAPWHQINKDLSDALADFLPRQMSQLERATVLSGILGMSHGGGGVIIPVIQYSGLASEKSRSRESSCIAIC